MSPIIQVPYVGERIRKAYHLPAPFDGTLSPDVVPVVLVDDLTDIGARAPRAAMGRVNSLSPTANAGVLLSLPTTGATVLRCTGFDALGDRTEAAGGVGITVGLLSFAGLTGSPLEETTAKGFLDTKLSGRPSASVYSFDTNTVTLGFTQVLTKLYADTSHPIVRYRFPQPISIYHRGTTPTWDTIYWLCDVGTISIHVTPFWEEIDIADF